MQCERARDLLGAYRDAELSSDERRSVEQHLKSCQACSDILADDERIGRSLQRLGRTQPPPALGARVRAGLERIEEEVAASVPANAGARAARPSGWSSRRIARIAAALAACCVLSALTTWWVMTSAGQGIDRIEHDVASAHIRSLLQDQPVQVSSSDQHTVRPWFAGRADFAPDVKDLTPDGFPLIGGRLDYIAERRVAAAVYKRRLHIINVFMWPSVATADRAPQIATRNGYNLLSWSRNGMAYWAASDLNAEELRHLQRLL